MDTKGCGGKLVYFQSVQYYLKVGRFTSAPFILGKPSEKKLQNLWQPANFNSHLPTLPNYDINIYDKAVKI